MNKNLNLISNENLNKQDIHDMNELLYFYYKTIQQEEGKNIAPEKLEKPNNIDVSRILELKRKLNILIPDTLRSDLKA